MLFALQNSNPNAAVVELGDEIFVNGQGYNLASLEILPGRFIGSPNVRSVNSSSPAIEPLLLNRTMVDARRFRVMRNTQDEWTTDGTSSPTSIDMLTMGFGACPPASVINDRDFIAYSDTPMERHYRGKFQPDGIPLVDYMDSKATAGGTTVSKVHGLVTTGKNKYQVGVGIYAGALGTYPVDGYLRTDIINGAMAPRFYAGAGFVLDATDDAIALASTHAGTLSIHRALAGNMATTTMINASITGSAGDIAIGSRVGVPAQLVDGKRRSYVLAVRTTGTNTTLQFVAGNYANISTAVPADFVAGVVDLNGFTVPKTKIGCTSFAYYVKATNGKSYIVAFIGNSNRGELGEVMVFEEVAFGQLKLIRMQADVVASGMRAVLAISTNNSEWLVMEDGTVSTWRWNDTKLLPERVASLGSIPPAAAGVDSMGRIWVVERTPSASVSDTYRIHVFPAAGSVSFVKAALIDSRYSYTGSPIMTTVAVEARDINNELIVAEVTVELTGPVVFEDGTRVKRVVTSSVSPTVVPTRVIGGGNLAVSASI